MVHGQRGQQRGQERERERVTTSRPVSANDPFNTNNPYDPYFPFRNPNPTFFNPELDDFNFNPLTSPHLFGNPAPLNPYSPYSPYSPIPYAPPSYSPLAPFPYPYPPLF